LNVCHNCKLDKDYKLDIEEKDIAAVDKNLAVGIDMDSRFDIDFDNRLVSTEPADMELAVAVDSNWQHHMDH
jgi:hypothetical protein